ncbi:MAG: sigma-54 dependent transcriptional regulator [Candidatus Wallbacteria bacterium]|nr:sigma-54 dependent transcriptional regulator [Candidatus Wallbacteria bacterium]
MSKTYKILFADDEKSVRMAARVALEKAGYEVLLAKDGREALELVKSNEIAVSVLDIKMPEIDGLTLLQKIKEEFEDRVMVIMVSAYNDMSTTIKAMKLGAYDFLVKPIDIDNLLYIVEKSLATQSLLLATKKTDKTERPGIVIEKSEKMHEIYKLIGRISDSDVTVLITGESGVGKEVIARALHDNSSRSERCFLAVNCTAIPLNLIESELFGHEKGAFTGAQGTKIGKFELANGGTLLLDEIGDMDIEVQAKLLRVLQEREIVRIGSNQPIKVDIRILAATNKNLLEAIREGKFREDLYHRLKVIHLHMPPLRERKVDIPILADYFVKSYNLQYQSPVQGVSKLAVDKLLQYSWPGNIRELKNVMESALAVCRDIEILPDHINLPVDPLAAAGNMLLKTGDSLEEVIRIECEKLLSEEASDIFDRIIGRAEFAVIRTALDKFTGNQVKTSAVLGINRNTLRSKMEKYKLFPGTEEDSK